MIDVFTRFATVIPIHNRLTATACQCIIEGIQKMNEGQKVNQPQILYGDDEGAWSKSTAITDYLRQKGI